MNAVTTNKNALNLNLTDNGATRNAAQLDWLQVLGDRR